MEDMTIRKKFLLSDLVESCARVWEKQLIAMYRAKV